ncbi:MAG: aldo/keto reductase [Firmicutes bacterium]|nr:aldo/keto reductase [Bacillota bacterium]
MTTVKLGSTGIVTNKNGFGALPIQRISFDAAAELINEAYLNGITYFDTARAYSDSEEKLAYAFKKYNIPRDKIYIASKTMATDAAGLWKDLETSLKNLETDYIDVYQLHNPAFCPVPGGEDGLYDACLEAKEKGLIRHIAITNHRMAVAEEAVESGLYELLQYPFNYLITEREIKLAARCKELNIGFVAMKGMSGGLITRAEVSYAFIDQYDNVLPIWGVQRMTELQQFLDCGKNPPVYDEEMQTYVAKEREELCGDFCRACGYCMPCPVGIQINDCARMSLLVRRAPHSVYLNESFQEKMQQIKECLHCGQCSSRCPYGLDTPALLEKNLADYEAVLKDRSLAE